MSDSYDNVTANKNVIVQHNSFLMALIRQQFFTKSQIVLNQLIYLYWFYSNAFLFLQKTELTCVHSKLQPSSKIPEKSAKTETQSERIKKHIKNIFVLIS